MEQLHMTSCNLDQCPEYKTKADAAYKLLPIGGFNQTSINVIVNGATL